MDYYMGKRIAELQRSEALRHQEHKRLARKAVKPSSGLLNRIKSALQIELSGMCCYDTK